MVILLICIGVYIVSTCLLNTHPAENDSPHLFISIEESNTAAELLLAEDVPAVAVDCGFSGAC